jgi:hypothetical protein
MTAQTLESNDFGQYLVGVAERDVDLLLMEEFHASDEFVAWFCSKIGLSGAHGEGAWHSVSDADGETDLLLRVFCNRGRVGVFIENKIGASEQHQQSARYHLRGARARDQGRVDHYLTVICAPARYLAALDPESTYQYRVSYEEIAAWFAKEPGRRSEWRRAVMQEAIEQSRRGYQVVPHAGNTAFHRAYWNYVRQHHPRIVMEEPAQTQGKNSTWIVLKGSAFPARVQLDHFPLKGILRLCLFGRSVDEALASRGDWPDGIMPRQTGRAVTLTLAVPTIDMTAPFETQQPQIETALQAAYRLIPFASAFERSRAGRDG